MTRTTKAQTTSLERRIRQFYSLLNQKEFERCFRMIDPRVRDNPNSVTLFQYQNSLSQFLDFFREVRVRQVDIALYLDTPSKLYEDRDFAVGQTVWESAEGEEQTFSERWVREGRVWYTRSTGFVTPGVNQVPPHPEASRSAKR
jgi:hypothetical protein